MDGNSKESEVYEISVRQYDLSDADNFVVWATDDQVSRYWNTYTSKEDAINDMKISFLHNPWFRAICVQSSGGGHYSNLT